jgi:ribosomal-protein-alanine acetyltransferase
MELGKLVIKEMEFEDLDEVLSMEASSSQTPWSKKMFIEELRNPLAHCFIVKNEGTPGNQALGFICFRNMGDESELLNILVHPQHRQLGMGKKLIQFYIDFCNQTQIRSFHLEVNASNLSAIHLYQLFSYHTVGVRKKFYQGKFDALRMVRKV